MKQTLNNAAIPESCLASVMTCFSLPEECIVKQFFYKSLITGWFTKFKVKSIEVNVTFVVSQLYGEVIFISDKGVKYNLESDKIFINPCSF